MLGQKILQFHGFTLDPNTASLCSGGQQSQLRPKSFDVLLYLARHPGRIITKDELIAAIWPNVFVTENSLVQCISDIRVALNDDAQAILKTIARRGYLFAAPIVEIETTAEHWPVSGRNEAPQPSPIGTSDASAGGIRAAGVASLWRHRYSALVFFCVACAAVAGAISWSLWPATDRSVSTADTDVSASAPRSKRISIAFLPLATPGAPSQDEYFADGLTEDIIAALGRFSELSVLSPKVVMGYKGGTARPDDLGRNLKVRYIAEGSLRRSPERVRISVRLTDASLGNLLWADHYDAEPANIFAIQDNITRQITGALAVRLGNAEQARVAAKPPSSLEAYDLVLRGRDFLSRLNRSATSNARTMFERAIELDPNYAAAYIGLGRVDLTAVALGWTPDPAGALRRAESLARKSIGIDEFNPAAHVLLGRTYARLGEYDRALDALKRAMAQNPSDPDTYAGLGDSLLWSGDIEAAIQTLETAEQLDPKLSTEDLFNLGAAYFLVGRNQEAVRRFERTIARNDSTAFIHAMLAAIHAEAGRQDELARERAELRRLDPFFDLTTFGSLFRNPEHRKKIVSALRQAGF
ncbi:MAG TPA: tetratricopeptide repeat protein [Xanthobacteraceae bacterium]|nr:tetratricopeptide repeat protein [Xanthobacteraceae bacterium]